MCAVKFCSSKVKDKFDSVPFPRDIEKSNNWKRLCHFDGPTASKRICLDHFNRSEDFYKRINQKNEVYLELKKPEPHLNLPSLDKYKEQLMKLQNDNESLIQQLNKSKIDQESLKSKFQIDQESLKMKFQNEKQNIIEQYEYVNKSLQDQINHQINQLDWANIQLKDVSSKLEEAKKQLVECKTASEFYDKFKLINPIVKCLIDNEINNQHRKSFGRRYDQQTKAFCLYVHLLSPSTYKNLKSIFTWPSPKTLNKQLDRSFLNTGLNESMLNFLKESVLSVDTVWSLVLDEIKLTPFLSFEPISGSIDGKADLAGLVTKEAEAEYALTFILTSCTKQLKVPLCFYFRTFVRICC